jgi:hypothetical protein
VKWTRHTRQQTRRRRTYGEMGADDWWKPVWKSEPTGATLVRWEANLVQSERVNGKPRHRVICRLGRCGVLDDLSDRIRFWRYVRRVLRRYDFDRPTWVRISAQLDKHCPHPTQAEIDAVNERERRWAESWGRRPETISNPMDGLL